MGVSNLQGQSGQQSGLSLGRRPVLETLVAGTVTDFSGVGAYMDIVALRRFVLASAPPPVPRVRFDLALRSLLVACVVLATTLASNLAGPAATGVLATYPVVFTSLVLILQPRWGGPFVASLLVNSLKGLVGFGMALAVLHLAAARISAGWALGIALLVAVGWNCALLFARRRSIQSR